jgi:poly-beta-1,6-N-acetyl-D-glucosamine synthase
MNPGYIAITPAKDEARNIEQTLRSMVRQTILPLRWIIVDDCSSDRTPEIVQSYAAEHSFISLLRFDRRGQRQTGIAEIVAFNHGFSSLADSAYDYIVKLDADLAFNSDYFERLLARFAQQPRLGIASGVYQELQGERWAAIEMPFYHAAGASKVLRKQCFEDIGGFIVQRGWDTVDEIRAMARGWQTTHFPELEMRHLKPEGTGMGMLRTCFMHGEIYQRTRGSWLFFSLKIADRLRRRPFITGALAMVLGYLNAALRGRQPLVTAEEGRCYRALLSRRIWNLLGRGPVPVEGRSS